MWEIVYALAMLVLRPAEPAEPPGVAMAAPLQTLAEIETDLTLTLVELNRARRNRHTADILEAQERLDALQDEWQANHDLPVGA